MSLNTGWNLIALTALPESPLTASSLLDEVRKQGGNASTVSTLTDGSWKSFITRGERDYSGEDFAIEPGKAYFVKALQKSTFSFTGQNLVSPIKLNLSSGWNAVGLPKTSNAYQASSLLQALNNTEADALSRWESGLWDTFVLKNEQKYGEDFSILGNRGYILRVNREGEFSP